jgi:hypothetical protein
MDHYRLKAGFLKDFACTAGCVVKRAGLPNSYGTGSDDENFLYWKVGRHDGSLNSLIDALCFFCGPYLGPSS